MAKWGCWRVLLLLLEPFSVHAEFKDHQYAPAAHQRRHHGSMANVRLSQLRKWEECRQVSIDRRMRSARRKKTTVHTKMITHLFPDRLRSVTILLGKMDSLGISRCICNHRIFLRNCYNSEEYIWLGIQICNCNCAFQEMNFPKQK